MITFGKQRRGATLVEAAFALPILLLFVFGTIDFVLYYYYSTTLGWAAKGAADTFSKLPVELDTTASRCGSSSSTCTIDLQTASPTGDNTCDRFYRTVQQATRLGIDRIRVVTDPFSTDSKLTMVPFTHFAPADYPNSMAADVTSGVCSFNLPLAILRPGERARRPDGTVVEHPTRPCSANSTQPCYSNSLDGTGWPRLGDTWLELLAANPVAVVMEADYKPFLPIFPFRKVSVVQLAYRARSVPVFGRPMTGALATPGPVSTVPPTIGIPIATVTPRPATPTPGPRECAACSTTCALQSTNTNRDCACCCYTGPPPRAKFWNRCRNGGE